MSKWVRCAGHWLLIGTLFVSLGGHLALLQTFAWGNMLVSFSKAESIAEAAKKTFDGDHPCSMCKVVKETKKQEEKKALLKSESKMEVALPVPVRLKTMLGVPVAIPVPEYFGQGALVSLGVPVRPPRIA
jgi:hypothetical protein